MDANLKTIAGSVKGFMPEDEGLALYECALAAGAGGPLLEIGSYCGKSTIYLGAAAAAAETTLFSLDHHRGSEEHQRGEAYFDPELVDPATGLVDSLGVWRATVARAGLEACVVGLVGGSSTIASLWATPLAFILIDGGHSEAAARADYAGWSPHLMPGGLLAIHDVFPNPKDGGRPPYLIHRDALASGRFEEVGAQGSLRVLQRV